MLGYKFRTNIDIKQDTYSLLENKLYASKLTQLNDPFETSIVEYLKDFTDKKAGYEALRRLFIRIKNDIGIYSLSIDKQGSKAILELYFYISHIKIYKIPIT